MKHFLLRAFNNFLSCMIMFWFDATGKWLGNRQIRCNWATKGANANDDKQSSDAKSVVELTNGTSGELICEHWTFLWFNINLFILSCEASFNFHVYALLWFLVDRFSKILTLLSFCAKRWNIFLLWTFYISFLLIRSFGVDVLSCKPHFFLYTFHLEIAAKKKSCKMRYIQSVF